MAIALYYHRPDPAVKIEAVYPKLHTRGTGLRRKRLSQMAPKPTMPIAYLLIGHSFAFRVACG
jgi:hypothetical protein